MADKLTYYSVGDLRNAIKDMSDDVPVVSAPLNKDVRVALDIDIIADAKLGDYTGNIVVFNTGLFDIKTGKRIVLSSEENNDEQGNN